MQEHCIDSTFLVKYSTQSLSITIGMYALLSVFIIWKMCQLCSKAFSYTNFHIHQAYKLYSMALLTTFLILVSRITEINLRQKNDTLLLGWIILDQIISIISIFAMNQLYLLAALTWLMVVNKCDFSNQYSTDHIDVDDPQIRFAKHKRIVFMRKILLYFVIPVLMLFKYKQTWCMASRIIVTLACTMVFIFVAYTFMKLFLQRYKSRRTPLKVKLIWVYMIIMISARQVLIIAQLITDIKYPIQQIHSFQATIWQNISLILYVIFITILPVLLLSYLAQKQLMKERERIQKKSQIFEYKSTFI